MSVNSFIYMRAYASQMLQCCILLLNISYSIFKEELTNFLDGKTKEFRTLVYGELCLLVES